MTIKEKIQELIDKENNTIKWAIKNGQYTTAIPICESRITLLKELLTFIDNN